MSIQDPSAGSFDGADYSDFEYQHFEYEHQVANQGTETNPLSTGFARLNPLDSIGGLDNNEIAELVYFELQPTIEFESEGGTQTVASSAEFRGAFGANLNDEPDIGDSGNVIDGTVVTEREDGSTQQLRFNKARTDDRLFQSFTANAQLPFSGADGGGGSSPSEDYIRVNMRDLTMRGPVLDASDDIVVASSINVDDLNQGEAVTGTLRAKLVWDTAEVSDAGRAFSVPK